MSHKATVWALDQRSIKGTTKIVLWHLCDRYNPEHGCFPSQELLAYDCQVSRSGLNNHLSRLEKCGLMRRERRIDPITKRQMSTRYILGFEEGFTPVPSTAAAGNPAEIVSSEEKPCPNIGHGQLGEEPFANNALGCATVEKPCPDFAHGAVSRKQADPCPENDQSRVQNLDTNLVREPLREPVKEEEDAAAREAEFDLFFAELLQALGFDANATLPAWWQGWPAQTHVRRWTQDLGLSTSRIIEVALETRTDHPNPPDGPKALDRFMERAAARDAQAVIAMAKSTKAKRRRKADAAPRPDDDELAAFYAAKVNADGFLPASMISTAMCGLMLARGLVTPERLRQRGVR
ncbi:helix-turn-helix domain-containing protein [Roseovarius autotrophicus]|uniref:helix-turn-helix domain-containing protein n=1 Tax=Roseovarius autotrophicus TaxID=2824121 RepID=UPI001B38E86B|nr:helix-turn-helix domain-containing protein [Roseovarius autotrophicus]